MLLCLADLWKKNMTNKNNLIYVNVISSLLKSYFFRIILFLVTTRQTNNVLGQV